MELKQMMEDLQNIGWRKYTKALRYAADNNIELQESDFLPVIIEIPEDSKIFALVEYSEKVRPISQKSLMLIREAVAREECVDAYKNHLYELLLTVRTA